MPFDQRITALNDFMKHCTPDVLLALLNELEAQEVTLPQRFDVKTNSCSEEPDGEWYARADVLAALATAGVRALEQGRIGPSVGVGRDRGEALACAVLGEAPEFDDDPGRWPARGGVKDMCRKMTHRRPPGWKGPRPRPGAGEGLSG